MHCSEVNLGLGIAQLNNCIKEHNTLPPSARTYMATGIRTCSADPDIRIRGHALAKACARPAVPCTAPGPDTVKNTPGWPVRKPCEAAA